MHWIELKRSDNRGVSDNQSSDNQGWTVFLWLLIRFGKSICYEVLLFLCDYCRRSSEGDVGTSLVVVISPLIVLMIDQALSL